MGGCESKDGASPSASRAAPAVQPEGRPGWWSPGLEDPECAAGLIALEGAGQQALLASFAKGKDVKKQKRLLRQAAALEKSYPGGLKVYVANAKKLLEDSAKGVNPLDGCKPSVPEGMVLYRSGDQYDQYCAKGLLEVPYCCFVIVAGGLGERLGFDGIKLSLPCETITMTCFLNLYIGYIKEWTALANEALKTPMAPQIAMMTSDDTHDKTVALLKENDYFGLGPKQITLMKQGKVPALKNGDADFATLPDDPYTILTKPHGHGDAHQLLYQHGLIKEWSAMGKRHVVFMQDTHSLVVFKLLAALGVSAEKGYAMNSITVPRKPGEESGSICTLQKDGAAALTINVEYNQLNPLLQSAFGRSDEADPATGYSPYPGNVNCFILKLEEYATVLTETKGCVPEFVNPKYADATRTTFKSPTRLECMMQDIPRFFPASALIGYVLFERSMYCPVKNACNTGAAKQAKGQQASCAVDGEHLWYANAASLLRECGADVAAPGTGDEETWMGVTIPGGARVVFSPSFCPSRHMLREKIGKNIKISSRSVLVIEGRDVQLNDLTLDGTLVIQAQVPEAKVVVDGLTVTNAGWRKVCAGADDPAAIKIRGYKTDTSTDDAMVLTFDTAGVHEVRDTKKSQL